jgi:hypothetical protein
MQKRLTLNLTLFVIILSSYIPAISQDSNETKTAFEKAQRMTEENSEPLATAKFLQSNLNTDAGLLKRVNEYNFMHQQRSFTWQYYSGIAIFILVIVIVAIGLLLSYQQFKLNERLVTSVKSTKVDATDKVITINTPDPASVFTTNTLEIGKDGVKINTAVIGLIILSLSIGFFFLYLKYVYPITFVN